MQSAILDGNGQGLIGGEVVALAPELPDLVAAPSVLEFDFGGGVAPTSGLSVAGAGRAAVGGLVRLTPASSDPAVVGSVLTARRTRVGSMGTTFDLDQSFSRTWTDPLSGIGNGGLNLMIDDADISGFQFDGNDLIQFLLNGEPAFTVIVEEPVKVALADGDEAKEMWKLGGAGHLSLLERAVVYPIGGVGRKPAQEDRVWDYTDPSYNDSSWVGAHIVTFVLWVQPSPFGADGQWGLLTGSWDVNFSDQTAAILWSAAGSIVNAPVGKVYGRQWFFMSAADDHAYFQGEADNACDFYLNGQLILSTTNYATRNDADISIPAGWNLLATVCENRPPAFAANPAGWAWATWDYGYPPTLYAHSDSSCKILAYPASPPGMAIGDVMLKAIAEAQARGALTWLSPQFTATHDSDGNLWPIAQVSTKVGTNYLTFFSDELGETYVDLWMAPGSTKLYAWNKRGRGSSSGVSLHGPTDANDPTTGNVTALIHQLVT